MDTKEVISAISALIALAVLIKGVIEYTKAQRWKKSEFLAKEINALYEDPSLKRAFKMLDWDVAKIPVLPDEAAYIDEKYFVVKPKALTSALRHHSENGQFTPMESLIRDIMDQLFFKLSIFQEHIDAGLIKAKDIKPYLIYYVRLLADVNSGRRTDEFRGAVANYLIKYDFVDVQRLFASFGYPVKK